MKNTGTSLEVLVEEIEKHLLPKGFSITNRKKLFAESGRQLAEFDLEIEGKVGSRVHRWLIECRDRPSDGAAPGDWIQQLDGRRRLFKFDAVTAVSTTGFSEGALIAAEDLHIGLRSVNAIDADSIRSWFGLQSAVAIIRRSSLSEVEVHIGSCETQELTESIFSFLRTTQFHEAVFRTPSQKRMSSLEIWNRMLGNRGELYSDLQPGSDPVAVSVGADFSKGDVPLWLVGPFGEVQVPFIRFAAEISIEQQELSIERVSEYLRTPEDSAIAQTVSLPFETENQRFEIRFMNFGDTEKTIVRCKVSDVPQEPKEYTT